MKLVIEIECDNSAFDPEFEAAGPAPEAASILRQLAESLDGTSPTKGDRVVLHDVNGNRVGTATWKGR